MNWRLTTGRLVHAWARYPQQRRHLRAVPPGPAIFLTGTHRSGTTWLARMLAASGIWYAHEPFNPNKGRWPKALEYRSPDAEHPDVDALMKEVLDGGFRESLRIENADHRLMPFRLLPQRVPRMMIKDPIACLMAGYLSRRFGLRTLVLFRHPAGFASSIARLGWPSGRYLRDSLADEALMREHLGAHRALLERYANEDSLASAAALHGALSVVLWNWTQNGYGKLLQFEQLCANPVVECERLFRELGLPYDEGVRAEHFRLCFSDTKPVAGYNPHAVERNSSSMATAWKEQLSVEQAREVRSIWDRFDLPLYREDGEW